MAARTSAWTGSESRLAKHFRWSFFRPGRGSAPDAGCDRETSSRRMPRPESRPLGWVISQRSRRYRTPGNTSGSTCFLQLADNTTTTIAKKAQMAAVCPDPAHFPEAAFSDCRQHSVVAIRLAEHALLARRELQGKRLDDNTRSARPAVETLGRSKSASNENRSGSRWLPRSVAR